MTASNGDSPQLFDSRPWAPEHATPLEDGWRRRTYERVFPPIWPLLAERLAPSAGRGLYKAEEVLWKTDEAAEALAATTPVPDQVRFLAAIDRPFEEALGPLVRGCRCAYCGPAREARRAEVAVPRAQRVRVAFVEAVAVHAGVVLSKPNDYDRAHGVLAVDWEHAGPGLPRRGLPVDGVAPGLGAALALEWLGREDARIWMSRTELALYRRVVRRAWAVAIPHLPKRGCDRAGYTDAAVHRLLEPVSLHLASAELTPAEQRAFLEATGALEGDWEHLFDAEEPCACQERRWGEDVAPGEAYCPRCLSRVFVAELADELRFAFEQGRPRDRALGAPRRANRPRPMASTAR